MPRLKALSEEEQSLITNEMVQTERQIDLAFQERQMPSHVLDRLTAEYIPLRSFLLNFQI